MSAATLTASTARTLATEHPEFRGWLDLLAIVTEEAAARAWVDAVPSLAADGAPCLAGAMLPIDPSVASAWLRRLFDVAARSAPALARAGERLEPLTALEAALALEMPRIDAFADAARLPREPLRAVLPLAAYPWLERCGARFADRAGGDHAQAWCPICGAWAALAEARGLESARRLRCGRCGADWRTEWLRCPFCGTEEHTRLRALADATRSESRRADGCAACGAWIKTVTTLAAGTAGDVRLLDLATVDLDIAALERGWKRPAGLGAPLGVRVVARDAKTTAAQERRRWWR